MVTSLQIDLRNFLGGKNFKGIYTKNPLSWTPGYHKFDRRKSRSTSFPISRRNMKGKSDIDWSAVFSASNVKDSSQPFPENPYTKTNMLIDAKLRDVILKAHEEGQSTQQISFSLGIGVPRIDAIVKLGQARKEFEKRQIGPLKHFQKDIQKMARTMTSSFPKIITDASGKPRSAIDNLTESPMSKQTRMQMFQTIAESEPFGPVDAAESSNIEPANQTLEKSTNVEAVEQEAANKRAKAQTQSFMAKMLEGERHRYRFTNATVGQVGFHYGAARDDQKPGRRVRHSPNGRRTYPWPEHS